MSVICLNLRNVLKSVFLDCTYILQVFLNDARPLSQWYNVTLKKTKQKKQQSHASVPHFVWKNHLSAPKTGFPMNFPTCTFD